MRSKKKATALTLAAAMLGSLLLVGAQASAAQSVVVCSDLSHQSCMTMSAAAAHEGAWSHPFADNPLYGDGAGNGRPPQTVEEAVELATAVSIAVMPSGRLIYWDGLSGIAESDAPMPLDAGSSGDTPDRSQLLDLGSSMPLWLDPSPIDGGGENMFCADQRLLASGEVIVAGGTIYQTEPYADIPDEIVPDEGGPDGLPELYGSDNVRLYSEGRDGGTWDYQARRNMNWRRWYPALITLANGELVAASGVSKLLWNSRGQVVVGDTTLVDLEVDDDHPKNSIEDVPVNVKQVEVFNPVTESWHDFSNPESEQSLPLFPRLHLLPNGDIFYTANGQMWGPAGEDVNEAGWNWQKTFTRTGENTAEWNDVNMGPFGARNGAADFVLPLVPNEDGEYDTMEIVVAGGTPLVAPGGYVAMPYSEKITVTIDDNGDANVSSEIDAMLNNPRWFSSGVVLPNGEALIFSGGDLDEVIQPGTERAVRMAELYDGEQWIELSEGSRDRVYHNSAVLLPDGSVLVGGHSPINFMYGPGGDDDDAGSEHGLYAHPFRDPSFERFVPPYLAGDRPEVLSSDGETTYGGSLTFSTAEGADVDKVVLSRLPSTTHVTDADARTVELLFERTGTVEGVDEYEASVPSNAAVLPPGYYYLFAVSSQGVPSIATAVKVDHTMSLATTLVTPIEIGMQQTRPDAAAARAATAPVTEQPAPASGSAVAETVAATLPASSSNLAAWLIAMGALALGAFGWRRAIGARS